MDEYGFGRIRIRKPDVSARFKELNHTFEVDRGIGLTKDRKNGSFDQVSRNRFSALELSLIFQLDLSGDGRNRGVNIADPGDRVRIPRKDCAALGVADDVLQTRNRQPLADARALVDALVRTGFECNPLDDLPDESRNHDVRTALGPCFLLCDRSAQVHGCGVMGFYLRTDTILERCDDLAAYGVVLRICRKHQHYIERHSDRIALNLNIAFLHNIE